MREHRLLAGAGRPGRRPSGHAGRARSSCPTTREVAEESPGELYDGTEIDEILTLRTLALSDAEKAAARATDPRAAALIDRVDAMDAQTMARLHGTIRAMTRPSQRDGPASPAGRRRAASRGGIPARTPPSRPTPTPSPWPATGSPAAAG